MLRFSKLIVALAFLGILSVPLTAGAVGVSFGGRVLSVLPCTGGLFHVTILAFRLGVIPSFEPYIWTPATVTKLYGPPLVVGQQLLGVADVPLVCNVIASPLFLPGLRMQTVGTSLSGSGAGLF